MGILELAATLLAWWAQLIMSSINHLLDYHYWPVFTGRGLA